MQPHLVSSAHFSFYTGNLSVARAAVLKNSLRSMHRMMQSSGTSEGLRGLIDSSLLKSIKKIMEHRVLFGPSVLSIGELGYARASAFRNLRKVFSD